MDLDALLAPVSEDEPTGVDMDGTTERYAIEEPFQLDAGSTLPEGYDWRGTIRAIVEQSSQTKDLWPRRLSRPRGRAGGRPRTPWWRARRCSRACSSNIGTRFIRGSRMSISSAARRRANRSPRSASSSGRCAARR